MTTRRDDDDDAISVSVASVCEFYSSEVGGERHEDNSLHHHHRRHQTTDGGCCAVSSPLLHALAGISASGDGMKTRSADSTQRLPSRSASPSPSSSSSSARDEETTPQRLSGRSLLRTLLPKLRDDEEEEHPSADERQRQHPEGLAQQSEDPPDLLETLVQATRRIEECVERLSRRVAGLEARLDKAILKEDSRHALCRQCCSTRIDGDDDDNDDNDDTFLSTPPPETNFCTTPSRLVRASPSPRLVDDFTRLYLIECCETEAE